MRLSVSVLLILVFGAITFGHSQKHQDKKRSLPVPKNVILMIGDGMGVTQVYSALTAQKGNLAMNRCENFGFLKTNSADNYITDSAAGATAISTGRKNNNGVLAISPNGDTLKTVLELAEEKGLATGLVATASIVHATPAGFISHNSNRDNYEEIAVDFLKTDVDVFIGGGRDYFEKRTDGRNLSDVLRSRKYNVVYNIEELINIKSGKIAGLLYDSHPPKYTEGRGEMLSTASLKAISLLDKSDKGFFIMIEGSQIDWGGHDNNSEYLVSEAVDFDRVVGRVLDFAMNDGETLVIITADHECGGYSITGGDISTGSVQGVFTSTDHTAVMVPLFAYGPGSHEFNGIIDNTDVFHKIVKLLNLK